MCGERAALFEKMKPCLTKYADATAQLCDSKCHGRTNVTAFLNNPAIVRAARMGGNLVAINDNLGNLCRFVFQAARALSCVSQVTILFL
ncbi:hypothetical protein TELCIR_07304 [Teladorsagia circumcincta]|uniref:Chondroitin proteoglycan 4 domain-containing protein n=1 Tax=Teladorsagia circumcincta TaxID=45464 RepID=A0A2G9UMW5_TELCI|nr:hypothetical protein TELCIR_07304 [Teladorsagia circumcincta]